MVTTTVSTAPPADWTGVTSISVRTLRPSGRDSCTSSARIFSALLSSPRWTSRPSANRQVNIAETSATESPGISTPATMRLASRFNDSGWPVVASNTTTPTGQVSTSASRSARTRRSARCAPALAIAVAACEANSTSNSSSSSVNASSFSPRKKTPTSRPW